MKTIKYNITNYTLKKHNHANMNTHNKSVSRKAEDNS
jgi:hypothetical protein